MHVHVYMYMMSQSVHYYIIMSHFHHTEFRETPQIRTPLGPSQNSRAEVSYFQGMLIYPRCGLSTKFIIKAHEGTATTERSTL